MQAFTVCLVVALCAFEAVNGVTITDITLPVQKAKNDVTRAIGDLERGKRELRFDYDRRMGTKKSDYMMEINNIINPTLAKFRSQVDAAKAEGKNAEPCYTDAKAYLREFSLNGFAALDKCQNTAKAVVNSGMATFDQQIAVGKELGSKYDRVLPNCMTSNVFQLQSCVAQQMAPLAFEKSNFESSVSSTRNNVQSNNNNAFNTAISCYSNEVADVRRRSTELGYAVDGCVKVAAKVN